MAILGDIDVSKINTSVVGPGAVISSGSLGQIKYLNTNMFAILEVQMRTMKTTLKSKNTKIKSTTTSLLDTWEGKGANQFETEYLLVKREMEDLYDDLCDLYEGLLAAQQQYEQADQQVAAAISSN